MSSSQHTFHHFHHLNFSILFHDFSRSFCSIMFEVLSLLFALGSVLTEHCSGRSGVHPFAERYPVCGWGAWPKQESNTKYIDSTLAEEPPQHSAIVRDSGLCKAGQAGLAFLALSWGSALCNEERTCKLSRVPLAPWKSCKMLSGFWTWQATEETHPATRFLQVILADFGHSHLGLLDFIHAFFLRHLNHFYELYVCAFNQRLCRVFNGEVLYYVYRFQAVLPDYRWDVAKVCAAWHRRTELNWCNKLPGKWNAKSSGLGQYYITISNGL